MRSPLTLAVVVAALLLVAGIAFDVGWLAVLGFLAVLVLALVFGFGAAGELMTEWGRRSGGRDRGRR